MEQFVEITEMISGALWGYPLIVLLVGTHIFLTIRLRIPQRHIIKAIKLTFAKEQGTQGDVSAFGALATALAATIGTGNLVGVGTAIALGGPGAVFWCWLTGVLGMATKYSEGLLAVKFRVKTENGEMLGGPMYALERGLGMKWLAILFSVFTAIAAFGIGNMVQANAVADLLYTDFNQPTYVTGIIITTLVGLVMLGGVKSISKVCSLLVPFMALFYILGCIYIICCNHAHIWAAISLIVRSAFNPEAAGGGFVGGVLITTIRYGVARGLFSNESGMGSAPIVAAAAKAKNPVRQALVSMTGTFWDTVIICAMTGIVLVSCLVAYPGMECSQGTGMMRAAFGTIPVVGSIVLAVGLFTFAFSTLLGWSYYGEKAIEYLGGKKVILLYRILFVIGVFVGSILSLKAVWNIADSMNALMAIPNLISLLLLSNVLVKETRKYLWKKNKLGVWNKHDLEIEKLEHERKLKQARRRQARLEKQ
ncbi:MAG: sodium:alanine symporter family protein [Paludibacteraceae bacterium]|nr:sodium:alanine symporter family protein [Paludibacteraceae bacterium]